METKLTKNIDLDFYQKKYITVDAKQFDRGSRYLEISCRRQGDFVPFDKDGCFAFIRYRKPDGLGVFNTCSVTEDGKISVELTEQMLAIPGMCYADIVIVDRDETSGPIHDETELMENSGAIISAMNFCVNVIGTPINHAEIESSYEFNALNDLILQSTKDYSFVIEQTTDLLHRTQASEQNAKDAAELSSQQAAAASDSADSAKASESGAKLSETNAHASELASKAAETASETSAANAQTSETLAGHHESTAAQKAAEAANSAAAAKASESGAKLSETNAMNSESASAASEQNAGHYADLSKSYAIGTNGETRENDDSDCASYFYDQTRRLIQSINGIIPMGTITFDELSNPDHQRVGYMFNISDTFVSDDRFSDGGGITYGAGNNAIYTADGKWDVLAASMLSGVKGAAESEYRQGFVNISPENVGAVSKSGDTMTGKLVAGGGLALNASTTNDDNMQYILGVDDYADGGTVHRTSKANLLDPYLEKTADTKDSTVSFTSGDSSAATSWTNVTSLKSGETHSSIFHKISTMFKNVRFLYKMLGTTDISTLGGGTVTGAISALNTNMNNKQNASTAITTSNIGSQSVNYANSAGSAVDQTARNTANSKYGKGSTPEIYNLDIISPIPFIDFHYNNSSADYTSRIIEEKSGMLVVSGGLKANGQLTATGGAWGRPKQLYNSDGGGGTGMGVSCANNAVSFVWISYMGSTWLQLYVDTVALGAVQYK